MKAKVNHLFKLILSALLGLLGFSSCESLSPSLMYGQPHADFHASGKVTDPSGKGIEGIRVAVRQHGRYRNEDDTLYTNSAGQFELLNRSFDGPTAVTVVFEDIDGEEHGGRFDSQTVKPKIVQTRKGDGQWYGGAFEVEANAELKKQ